MLILQAVGLQIRLSGGVRIYLASKKLQPPRPSDTPPPTWGETEGGLGGERLRVQIQSISSELYFFKWIHAGYIANL